MRANTDVVIVGGGAAGCAVAYYLGLAGVRVSLIERQGIGTQASGYAAGGLNPLQGLAAAVQPLAMASFQMHADLGATLKALTGRDGQLRQVSAVKLAVTDPDCAVLHVEHAQFEATPGFAAHWIDHAAMRELEPRITPDFLQALCLDGNRVVDSYQYTLQLAEAAQHYGATIRLGTVRGLQRTDGRVTGVVLDDGVLACHAVVLAMGPWARAAEAWLGVSIPVEPLKGEILRMDLPGPALAYDFSTPGVSLYGRAGQVWCGATTVWCGFDTAPSATARRTLLHGACALMPAMAHARIVQHTACLRPVASDWLPVIGHAPGWDNVYLAAGGEKKGILLSPAMGKAIADLITTGTTALDIAPCTPQRFVTTLAGPTGERRPHAR